MNNANFTIPDSLVAQFVGMYPRTLSKTMLNVGYDASQISRQFAAYGFVAKTISVSNFEDDSEVYGLLTAQVSADFIVNDPSFLEHAARHLEPAGVFVMVVIPQSVSSDKQSVAFAGLDVSLGHIRKRFRIIHRQKMTFGYMVICRLRK
jgi:hypothetical protein